MSGDWGGERHGAGRGQLTTSLNSDSDNENDSESDSERLSPRDAGIYWWLDLVIIVCWPSVSRGQPGRHSNCDEEESFTVRLEVCVSVTTISLSLHVSICPVTRSHWHTGIVLPYCDIITDMHWEIILVP